MNKLFILQVATGLIFSALSVHTFASSWNHCKADEDVVFYCPTNKNVISVCASKNISNETGYIQYRYGNNLVNPEISIPIASKPPRFNTEAIAFLSPDGEWNGYIKFKNGNYSYVVYYLSGRGTYSDPAPNFEYGVMIEKNGKKISKLKCTPYAGFESKIEPEYIYNKAKFTPASSSLADDDTLSKLMGLDVIGQGHR